MSHWLKTGNQPDRSGAMLEGTAWSSRSSVKEIKAFQEGMRVRFHDRVWRNMYGWCRAAKSEMSGLGLVKKEGNVFTVYDVFILKQECSSGFTQIDDDQTSWLMNYLHKRGSDIKDLKFWFHTHYDFNTFWSGTDVDTARRLCGNGNSWMLSTVINQAGDHLTRLDLSKPVVIALDEIKTTVMKGPRRKRKRRNYRKDISKYVRPMETFHFGPKMDEQEDGEPANYDKRPNNSYQGAPKRFGKYIIYGGQLISYSEYEELRRMEHRAYAGSEDRRWPFGH